MLPGNFGCVTHLYILFALQQAAPDLLNRLILYYYFMEVREPAIAYGKYFKIAAFHEHVYITEIYEGVSIEV